MFHAKEYFMKKRYFLLEMLLLVTMILRAQTMVGLRDSLAKATRELSYHPDSVDLRLKKVRWNIQLEQWDYAKDELDKLLFIDKSNLAGLYFRAFVNEKLHRFNFARQDYETLLTLAPGNFEAQLGLSLLNQKDGHYTEALDQINRLVEAFPDSAVAFAARGGIETERGFYELAEYDYSQAICIESANTDYLLNRAHLRLLLKRYAEARADLDRLVQLGVPRVSLADYYRQLRKKQ